jgi:hypothetical protein
MNNTVTEVKNLQFYDGGISGTARDLKIRFLSAPDESVITNYRILLHESLTPLTAADIEGAGPASYVDVPAGEGIYATTAEGYQTFEGNPVLNEQTYGLVVASMNSAGSVIAKVFTTGKYSDSDVKVEALFFEDRADYNDPRDFHVTFSEPSFADSISSYGVLLSRTTALFPDSVLLATSEDYVHVISSALVPVLNYQLPADLKDFEGNAIEPSTYYRVSVISKLILSDTIRRVIAISNSRYVQPNDWEVNDFKVSALASGELKVDFKAADFEDYLSEYRLLIVPAADVFTLEEAILVPDSRRQDFAIDGSSDYAALFPGTILTIDGLPINDGLIKRAYILSYVDSEYAALEESDEPFLLLPPSGIQGAAEADLQLYTTSVAWIVETSSPVSELRLSDALGRLLYVEQPNSNLVEVGFANLPAGVYILQVRKGTQWSSNRVVRP